METTYSSPSVGLNAATGGTIEGWAHVAQSLQAVFNTRFGDRIMLEWFGSFVPAILGRNINQSEIPVFFSAFTSAIEQWEPRYSVTGLEVLSINRSGELRMSITGEYRPRALLGDTRPDGLRTLVISATDAGLTIDEGGIA
jgi:phage baseplate assembly protein W